MLSKTYFLTLLLLLGGLTIFAQELDKYGRDIEALTLKKKGLNKDHYNHFFLSYGFLLGETESDSAKTLRPGSSAFQLGYLFKWRMSSWYELGLDVMYHYNSFHIKQDSMKIAPNSRLVKREKLVFNNIQLAPFQRFKFKNKHHSAGIFLDIGAFLGYNYRIKHQTEEQNRTPSTGKTKTINLRLKYTEDFAYGVMARVGFNRVVIYGRYRFSDLFTNKSGLPELSRIEAGIRIGLHR